MKRIALTIILSVALGKITFCQDKFDKVLFYGNRNFSFGELNNFLDLPKSSLLSDEKLSKHFQNLEDSLIIHDFLFAKIDSHIIDTRNEKTYLQIYIREGQLAKIGNLRWLGDSTAVPSWLYGRMVCGYGSSFHWDNLKHDTNLLLDYFQNNGYPFARIQLEKIEPNEIQRSVQVWFKILSGPYTKIEFIEFQGNNQTDSNFLLRESRLKNGSAFDQRKIESAHRFLSRLGFLNRVQREQFVVNDEGKTGLRFVVNESKSTHLDIVAGYVPGQGNSSGQFNGLANIEFLNLFGVGRKGRVHWERPSSKIQNIELSYEEPWIFNWPLSAKGEFKQRIQDTLYVKRNLGLTGKFNPIAGLNIWGSVSREDVLVDSVTEIITGVAESHTNFLESGISFDTRDHPTNPRSGIYFSSFVGSGWRKRTGSEVSSSKSFKLQRGGLDSEVALEVFPFWIASLDLHARVLQSDEAEILLPDLYRLGGARTLRGYHEEQFLGSRIGWSSLEMRYWLGNASRVFAFLDGGSYYRKQFVNSENVVTNELKLSTGLGLRLESGLGVWGFDYGIGENDNLLSGKIHVSLLSSF